MGLADIQVLLVPAAAIALLIYADSGVTGQVLGRRGRYRVDGDGEFMGLGTANIGASLTGGFPVNGSQSRSFTAADMGARSQLVSLVAVALVVFTLLFLTPLFAPLPKAALAGVIIVVAAGLLDPAEFRRLSCDRALGGRCSRCWRPSIVVAVGMLAGVLIIALLSLLLVAQRAARPRRAFLVQVPGTDSYRAAESTPDGRPEPGLVVYRFDAQLFFANAEVFRADVTDAVAAAEAPVRWVVLDMEAVADIDSTADPDAPGAQGGPRGTRRHARVRAAQGSHRGVSRPGECRGCCRPRHRLPGGRRRGQGLPGPPARYVGRTGARESHAMTDPGPPEPPTPWRCCSSCPWHCSGWRSRS